MITNYMIIGYGWRADFYYRIAKLLPERFSVCAGVLRTEERAKDVGRILRTFKIKKNVEVTDNGKIII